MPKNMYAVRISVAYRVTHTDAPRMFRLPKLPTKTNRNFMLGQQYLGHPARAAVCEGCGAKTGAS